jgi:tetratricopeptide (TPR) repeat protein
MGRLDEAAETARQATERFPLLPRIWLDLASVYRAQRDLVHEKEAIEKALHINPNWSLAVRTLADLHEKQGDFGASRQVLERAVACDPLNAINHGYLAHTLWKLGEKAAALDQAEQAARLDPHYEWAWARVREWVVELGGGERSIAVARDLVKTRPGESNSWLLLARALGGADTLSERLEALDKAIAVNPRNESAYDLKAAILSEARRIDEALAVCRPQVWGDQPPALLRIRAARAASANGRVDEAVVQLKALVTEDPLNYSAWEYMADICANANRHAEHLEAARHMHQLLPTAVISLGYLGWALERNEHKAEAKTHFHQAFELDPDYSFAGMHLFDLHLDDNETEQARKVLAILKAHVPGPYVTAREVQLAARLRDFTTARAGFDELCARPADADWPLDAAAKALADGQLTDLLDGALCKALKQPKVHPNVGCVWLRHIGATQSMRRQERFVEQIISLGEAGTRATCDLLNILAKGDFRRRLLRFIDRHRTALHSRTRLWGQVGYALSMRQAYRETVSWLADYQSRQDAQPWMLFNLVFSLQNLCHDHEADEVAQFAAKLPEDSVTPCFHAITAFYQGLRGETAEAAKRLEQVNERSISGYDRHILELARALCAAGSGGPDRAPYEAAHKHLTAARQQHPAGEVAARRLYRLTVRRIAHLRGGWRGLVWYVRAPGPCPKGKNPLSANLALFIAAVGLVGGGSVLGLIAIIIGARARHRAGTNREWGKPELAILLGFLAIVSFIVRTAIQSKLHH